MLLTERENSADAVMFVSTVEGETRCYDELGCLNITRDWYHLIYRPFNVFPLPREVIDTRFVLYTRKNPVVVSNLLFSYTVIILLNQYQVQTNYAFPNIALIVSFFIIF